MCSHNACMCNSEVWNQHTFANVCAACVHVSCVFNTTAWLPSRQCVLLCFWFFSPQDCLAEGVLMFAGTWFCSSASDMALRLASQALCGLGGWWDFGKSQGGVCICVSDHAVSAVDRGHCSADLECNTSVMEANVCSMRVYRCHGNLIQLSIILKMLSPCNKTKPPEAVYLIVGNLSWATRGARTLDKAYSNIKHGYRTNQPPHRRSFQHMFLLLISAYKLKNKVPPHSL